MTITITAALVKELRERTGSGMMECKRALSENQGDIEKAIDAMRKSGQAKADKKASRIAAEGILLSLISEDRKTAVLLEINCETDFVARDQTFVDFAHLVAQKALSHQVESIENLLKISLSNSENSENIENRRQALVGKIGENIQIRRYVYKTSTHQLFNYVHNHRIGALVELENATPELGKDIAMSIVASAPLFVKPEEVPLALIHTEKEIFSAQALSSGKPEKVIEKMIDGRIKKFLDEICLLSQPFVKNPDQTIEDILNSAKAIAYSFHRLGVGEGIEKPAENFAEEVMKQVQTH